MILGGRERTTPAWMMCLEFRTGVVAVDCEVDDAEGVSGAAWVVPVE